MVYFLPACFLALAVGGTWPDWTEAFKLNESTYLLSFSLSPKRPTPLSSLWPAWWRPLCTIHTPGTPLKDHSQRRSGRSTGAKQLSYVEPSSDVSASGVEEGEGGGVEGDGGERASEDSGESYEVSRCGFSLEVYVCVFFNVSERFYDLAQLTRQNG